MRLLIFLSAFILNQFSLATPALPQGESEIKLHDGQTVLIYTPKAALSNPSETKLLFSIHGYTGRKFDKKGLASLSRARSRWKSYAEEHNLLIVAPHFDKKRFRGFNTPGRRGLRPDKRLIEISKIVAKQSSAFNFERFLLFGFSAGGQFAHRFTILHPQLIERVVVGAPGWYWVPDKSILFPVGMKDDGKSADVLHEANWGSFTKIPVLLLIGEGDKNQGSFRESFNEIDLNIHQGYGRLSRAQTWLKLIKNKWPKATISLQTIPNTEHSISKAMKDAAIKFLVSD